MIPDYDTVVIDEAHELTARVTQAATDELGVSDIERAARRAMRWTDGDGDPAGDLEDAAQQLAEAIEATPPGRIDQVSVQLSRRPRARARRGARVPVGVPARVRRRGRGRRRPHPGQGHGAGGLRQRRADGGRLPGRRAVAGRGPRPLPGPPPRGAPAGVGPDARQAAHRQDGRLHQRDADARRRVRRRRHLARPQAHRAGRPPGRHHRRRRRAAVEGHRRRLALRLRPAVDPLRRPPPAAARPRRARPGAARRDLRPRRRPRRPHARSVLVPARRGDRGRGGARRACPT